MADDKYNPFFKEINAELWDSPPHTPVKPLKEPLQVKDKTHKQAIEYMMYVPEAELKTGQYGPLYMARDRKGHDERVALKITPDNAYTEYRKELEERAVTRIKKNCVGIERAIDYFLNLSRDVHYIGGPHANMDTDLIITELDLIEGIDLNELHRIDAGYGLSTSHRWTSEDEITAILYGIKEGLKFLHMYDVAHRNISLSNVMITPRGHVTIVDMTFSAVIEPGEPRQSICGIGPYRAPEMVTYTPGSDESQGLSVDVWSMGVLAVHIRSPAEADLMDAEGACLDVDPQNRNQCIRDYFDAAVPVFIKQADDASPMFDHSIEFTRVISDFCQKCLTLDPEQRPKPEDFDNHFLFAEYNGDFFDNLIRMKNHVKAAYKTYKTTEDEKSFFDKQTLAKRFMSPIDGNQSKSMHSIRTISSYCPSEHEPTNSAYISTRKDENEN